MMRTSPLLNLALGATVLLSGCSGRTEQAPAPSVAAPTPAVPSEPTPGTESLTFDPAQSSIRFVASKITASHEGRFSDVSGHLDLDPTEMSRSRFDVRVGIGSLSIEPARLQGHLLTPDLLDATAFPDATFRSVSIGQVPGGSGYVVSGDLTIHGRSKRIDFLTRIDVRPDAVVASADVMLDRRDFGVIYPGMPDDLIKDQVVLHVSLRAPRTPH